MLTAALHLSVTSSDIRDKFLVSISNFEQSTIPKCQATALSNFYSHALSLEKHLEFPVSPFSVLHFFSIKLDHSLSSGGPSCAQSPPRQEIEHPPQLPTPSGVPRSWPCRDGQHNLFPLPMRTFETRQQRRECSV